MSEGGFGPGFEDARSPLYRLEYAALTAALLRYLIYRTFFLGGLDWLSTVFWGVFPDFVFIPIGMSARRKEWPPWGARLYNVFHTVLLWGAVFVFAWALLGMTYWPLLGWLVHISLDRAVGYGLRRPS